jgi:hypothetical protein
MGKSRFRLHWLTPPAASLDLTLSSPTHTFKNSSFPESTGLRIDIDLYQSTNISNHQLFVDAFHPSSQNIAQALQRRAGKEPLRG